MGSCEHVPQRHQPSSALSLQQRQQHQRQHQYEPKGLINPAGGAVTIEQAAEGSGRHVGSRSRAGYNECSNDDVSGGQQGTAGAVTGKHGHQQVGSAHRC